MRLCRTGPMGKPVQPESRRYFRHVATVALDAIANQTYDFNIKRLSGAAAVAKAEHPKLAKVAASGARYAFWAGAGGLEWLLSTAVIGQHGGQPVKVGPVISCSLIYGHLYPISLLVQRLKKGKEAMARKPSGAAYSGAFGILESVSIPVYTFTMKAVVSLSHGAVRPFLAAVAVVAATLAAIAVEYPGFRFIWQKTVLRGTVSGSWRDDLRGFLDEFRPLRMFKPSQENHPATTTGGYVGQVWGVIESHFIWLQGVRVAFAVGLAALVPTNPTRFVDWLFSTSAFFMMAVSSVIITRNFTATCGKIEENNRALGLDQGA